MKINGSIYFFSGGSSCVSFSSKSERWSRFSLSSDIASDLCYHCGGGAGDSNKFYFLFDEKVTVIDVNSSKERTTCKRKSDENYMPY